MKKIKTEDAINEYLEYVKLKRKKNTYLTIERKLNKHFNPFFKNIFIEDITVKDYLNWQLDINKQDFKYNHKSSLHYAVSGFYDYLSKFYGIENIARKVGNFKNNDVASDGNIWTIDEFKQFIKWVDDEYYKLLFELLYFTGLRKGEALALKWEDINFYTHTLSINKTITRTHELQTPKTRTSYRLITLDEYMINNLRKLYKNNNHDFIFKSITFTTLLRKKNKYCKLAGVKQIKIHEFRHSHACLLFMNDVPIDEISHRLGHSKISITTDTYLKYIPIKEKRVINTLNSLHCF